MPAETVAVKPALHNEFRAMTSGLAAFSVATLLMLLQGSFGELNQCTAIAAILFTAGVPISVSASTLSLFFSRRPHVPVWANSLLDTLMSLGWGGGIVGFGFLLFAKDGLLGKIFLGSIIFAFVAFCVIAYLVGEHDKKANAKEPNSDGDIAPEIEDPAVEIREG